MGEIIGNCAHEEFRDLHGKSSIRSLDSPAFHAEIPAWNGDRIPVISAPRFSDKVFLIKQYRPQITVRAGLDPQNIRIKFFRCAERHPADGLYAAEINCNMFGFRYLFNRGLPASFSCQEFYRVAAVCR